MKRALGDQDVAVASGRARSAFKPTGTMGGPPVATVTTSGRWYVQHVIETWMPEFPDQVLDFQARAAECLITPGEYPEPYAPGTLYGAGKAIVMPYTDPVGGGTEDTIYFSNQTHTAGGSWTAERDLDDPAHPGDMFYWGNSPSSLWLRGQPAVNHLTGAPDPLFNSLLLMPDGFAAHRAAGFPLATVPEAFVGPSAPTPFFQGLAPNHYAWNPHYVTVAGDDYWVPQFLFVPAPRIWGVPRYRNPIWVP